MAITCNYEKKAGEAIFLNKETKELETVAIYPGNCMMVCIKEVTDEETGEIHRYLYDFLADVPHAKNVFGLTKGYNNLWDNDRTKLLKLTLNPTVYQYTKELLPLLIKAFDRLTIEIEQ